MQECNLVICDDGTIVGIYNDDLVGLLSQGRAEVRRASHVEPADGGGWEADMRPAMGEAGPVLRAPDGQPFKTRAEALAAEVAYINREVLHVQRIDIS